MYDPPLYDPPFGRVVHPSSTLRWSTPEWITLRKGGPPIFHPSMIHQIKSMIHKIIFARFCSRQLDENHFRESIFDKSNGKNLNENSRKKRLSKKSRILKIFFRENFHEQWFFKITIFRLTINSYSSHQKLHPIIVHISLVHKYLNFKYKKSTVITHSVLHW